MKNMKKSIIAIISILLVAGSASVCQAAKKKSAKKVVYSTSMHCKACANKVQDNITRQRPIRQSWPERYASWDIRPKSLNTRTLNKWKKKLKN